MLSNEEIDEQLKLLQTYRRTLSILLQQQAATGKAFSPPSVVNSIYEARGNIQRIKAALAAAGVAVAAELNDEEAPDPVLVVHEPGRRTLLVALMAGGMTVLLLVLGGAVGFLGNVFAREDTAHSAATIVTGAAIPTAKNSATSVADALVPTTIPSAAPTTASESIQAVPTAASDTLLREYTFSSGRASSWAGAPEQWQVVQDNSNFVYQAQAAIDKHTSTSPPDTEAMTRLRNYAIEARVRVVQPGLPEDNLADFWLALRAHHSPTPCVEYDFNFFTVSNEAFIFRNGQGGCSFTSLAQGVANLDTDTWNTIRAEVVGTQLRLLVNGTQVLSATNDQIAEGFFYFNVGPGAVVQFDDIRIYKL